MDKKTTKIPTWEHWVIKQLAERGFGKNIPGVIERLLTQFGAQCVLARTEGVEKAFGCPKINDGLMKYWARIAANPNIGDQIIVEFDKVKDDIKEYEPEGEEDAEREMVKIVGMETKEEEEDVEVDAKAIIKDGKLEEVKIVGMESKEEGGEDND